MKRHPHYDVYGRFVHDSPWPDLIAAIVAWTGIAALAFVIVVSIIGAL